MPLGVRVVASVSLSTEEVEGFTVAVLVGYQEQCLFCQKRGL